MFTVAEKNTVGGFFVFKFACHLFLFLFLFFFIKKKRTSPRKSSVVLGNLR